MSKCSVHVHGRSTKHPGACFHGAAGGAGCSAHMAPLAETVVVGTQLGAWWGPPSHPHPLGEAALSSRVWGGSIPGDGNKRPSPEPHGWVLAREALSPSALNPLRAREVGRNAEGRGAVALLSLVVPLLPLRGAQHRAGRMDPTHPASPSPLCNTWDTGPGVCQHQSSAPTPEGSPCRGGAAGLGQGEMEISPGAARAASSCTFSVVPLSSSSSPGEG